MQTEWQANPRARERRVERTQFRQTYPHLRTLRVRVMQGEVWRMTANGRESLVCKHQHQTTSSALRCAEMTAGRMNKAERKATR
jgi:hypothetical protein